MKIFLTGFMGSGKTTLGRKLAARLNCDFIDLDQVLESQAGITIPQYFVQFGEDHFRAMESRVLKTMDYPEQAVIATGGGLPCFFNHMQWMNKQGTTIYIKLPPKALAARLENGRTERPLLHQKHGEDLAAFIQEKLAEREACYMQANIIADGLGLTAEKLEEIIGAH